MADPDLQISGGGGGWGWSPKFYLLLFGPQFGLILRREGKTTLDPLLISYLRMSLTSLYEYGRFPFVRIDRPDLFRRNDNQFPFNQNSLAKSVKS